MVYKAALTLLICLFLAAPHLLSRERLASGSSETLSVGYVLQYSPEYQYKDIKIAFRELLRLYASNYGLNVNVIYYNSEKRAVDDFCRGKIVSISAPGIVWANNYKRLFPKSSIFYLASKSANEYVTHLLLRKKGSIAPLQSCMVSIPQSRYNALLYFRRYLLEHGVDPRDSLLKIEQTKNSRIAIFRLFFGKSDFAVVPKESWEIAVEMNPQLKAKIDIVDESPNVMVYAAGCYSKNLSPEMIQTVLEVNKRIAATPVGRKMLELLQINKYIEARPEIFYPYIKYVEETNRLMHSSGQKSGHTK